MTACLTLAIGGCSGQEGSAEKAGKAIDEAVEDVKEAADEVKDGMKEAGEELEE